MNTKNYAMIAALGAAVAVCAGCNNSSNNGNPPPATNSVSGTMPSTNGIMDHNPPEMNNAPGMTNNTGMTNK